MHLFCFRAENRALTLPDERDALALAVRTRAARHLPHSDRARCPASSTQRQHAVQATLAMLRVPCSAAQLESSGCARPHRTDPPAALKRLPAPQSVREDKTTTACTPTARKRTRHAARNANCPPGAKRRRKRRSRPRWAQCLRRATNLRDDEFGARDRVRCEKLVRLGRIEQLRVVAQLAASAARNVAQRATK